MQERWAAVVGFSGYEVSDLGRVRSRFRVLRASPHHKGGGKRRDRLYRRVGLSVRGEVTYRYVHHLVLEAFVGPRPADREAAHWDGDPGNNELSNLRWATKLENLADEVRLGRMPAHVLAA